MKLKQLFVGVLIFIPCFRNALGVPLGKLFLGTFQINIFNSFFPVIGGPGYISPHNGVSGVRLFFPPFLLLFTEKTNGPLENAGFGGVRLFFP